MVKTHKSKKSLNLRLIVLKKQLRQASITTMASKGDDTSQSIDGKLKKLIEENDRKARLQMRYLIRAIDDYSTKFASDGLPYMSKFQNLLRVYTLEHITGDGTIRKSVNNDIELAQQIRKRISKLNNAVLSLYG